MIAISLLVHMHDLLVLMMRKIRQLTGLGVKLLDHLFGLLLFVLITFECDSYDELANDTGHLSKLG